MRNDDQELIGINKNVSSSINMKFDDNAIETITFFKTVDGDIYPETELPENARKLRGFIWRGEERLRTKDDIFSEEENAMHEKIQAKQKREDQKEQTPMKVRKETLNYDKKK